MISETLEQRTLHSNKRIVFADAHDVRVLDAVSILSETSSCAPIVLIDRTHATSILGSSLSENVQCISPATFTAQVSEFLLQRRSSKGLTTSQAEELATNPLFTAGWMVAAGLADGAVAGSISTTGEVIRAALWTIGLAPGNSTLSSYFLMDFPEKFYLFADCGVVPDPTTQQLQDIAFSTATSLTSITRDVPKVAFVSFSTLGSAQHPAVHKVAEAAKTFRITHSTILSDGELQIDAAIIPSVAMRKAPESPLRGEANILIFPDLNSGNSAYKLTERLAGAKAVGPILQGLAKPYCDLSRGCTSADIVDVARIAVLMSGAA